MTKFASTAVDLAVLIDFLLDQDRVDEYLNTPAEVYVKWVQLALASKKENFYIPLNVYATDQTETSRELHVCIRASDHLHILDDKYFNEEHDDIIFVQVGVIFEDGETMPDVQFDLREFFDVDEETYYGVSEVF